MDKALLTRATSKDDTPTPGYLYGEIARMTQHSYDTCAKVMEFMISRVKNKHHNIKYKALQVIKHACRDGRVDFKREMQKHIPTIKECLQFRGPPDPLKGDEYYRRVRDAAKECLDAIYDTDNAPGLSGMGMSARIQGVGNPADAASSGGGWGAKLPWGGKTGTAGEMPPPSNIGSLPSYNAPGGFGGYGGDANGAGYGGQSGGYGGPAPGGYGGPAPGYNGPNAGYGGPQAPAYGQPAPYSDTPGGFGAPPAPFGGPSQYGAPPPMNEQKIAGFGNPMYQDPRDEKSGFFKGLKEKAASKFTKPDPRPTSSFSGAPPGSANAPDGWSFATNRGPTSGAYGISAAGSYNPNETYQPGGGYSGGSAYAPNDQHQHQMTQLKEKAYDGDRKKGRVGGAWTLEQSSSAPAPAPAAPARDNRSQSFNSDARNRSSSRSGEYGYQQQQPKPDYSQSPAPLAPAPALGQTSGAQSDGNYERNLVTALCAPGGMRAIPPKDKLDAFIKSALTLDAEVVGPMLEDCLADAQWTVVSKALATIDALIKADGCEEYTDYFTDNFSEIESCAKSDKAAVRDRAVKILNHLGQSTSAPSAAAAAPAPRQSRSKPAPARTSEPDLLGFGDDDEPSDDGGSLFSGLQTGGVATQAPPAAAPAPAPAATASVIDMFGGLSLQSSAPAAAPAAPVAQPAAPAPPAPAPAPTSNSTLILDPLLEPVSVVNRNMGPQMNMGMGMMGGYPQQMQMQQMNQMQQMQQMQYMQQMQQMQQMQYMQQQQMAGMGGYGMVGAPGVGMGSQVIGAAMTPTGYIAKTIHEPVEEAATSDAGFNFMKRKDDSFNFIKDAMKNS